MVLPSEVPMARNAQFSRLSHGLSPGGVMNDRLRIHIPLTSRARILPPREVELERGQDPLILRAIGFAWLRRQLIELGEVTTLA